MLVGVTSETTGPGMVGKAKTLDNSKLYCNLPLFIYFITIYDLKLISFNLILLTLKYDNLSCLSRECIRCLLMFITTKT